MSNTYGLLGYPLGHTMSPPIHQALFSLYHHDADYRVFETPPQDLSQTVRKLLTQCRGFNVTIPYKLDIIPFLDNLDEQAKRYGSVNVVKCDGKAVGYNTDVVGFTKSIDMLGANLSSRVLLLGCGGVGRMIAIESALRGAELTVAVRPSAVAQAEKTAEEILALKPGAEVKITLIDRISGTFDLMINATPAGMYPNIDASPVEQAVTLRAGYLFDAIYNPSETKLMKSARANGVKTLGGMAMLVWQAAAAHEIWNGASFREADIAGITAEMEGRLNHA